MTRPKILVCDDYADLLDQLRHAFSGAGFDAEFIGDGETLARRAVDEGFDLVVTDLAMSPVDGWTAIERIRGMSKVTVWALSAYLGRDLMNQARAKELDVRLLEKPNDTVRLRGLIESHFGLNGAAGR